MRVLPIEKAIKEQSSEGTTNNTVHAIAWKRLPLKPRFVCFQLDCVSANFNTTHPAWWWKHRSLVSSNASHIQQTATTTTTGWLTDHRGSRHSVRNPVPSVQEQLHPSVAIYTSRSAHFNFPDTCEVCGVEIRSPIRISTCTWLPNRSRILKILFFLLFF